MVSDGIGSRKGRGPTKWGGPSKTISLRLYSKTISCEMASVQTRFERFRV